MLRMLLIFFTVLPTVSYASWNVVPDQTININVKYDQASNQFYDLSAFGSDLIEVSIVNGNEIKIKHGRDGYKGVVVPAYESHRYTRNSFPENRSHTLVGRSTNEAITIDIGRGSSKVMGMPTSNSINHYDGYGCSTTDTWTATFTNYEVFHSKTNSVYSGDWCIGRYSNLSQYGSFTFPNDGGQIGYIERYFKFSLDVINSMPLDEYVGTYLSHPTADVIRIGSSNFGRELYRYVISVNLKPSVNRFVIDNENISFSVNKQASQIKGKSQTGFDIRGSFHNSQAFDMTFNSSNSALCGEALCLLNSAAGTTIPYMVNVFDPATLLEKAVSRNGQKVTIYADQDYRLSGGLFFEFDTENTAVSGTFNDILTVRVELKLI
ncbi:hypothetical protein RJD39_21170 [Vibrio scophthalmi]|uniref:Uncharacterized protein n=1 Tax=Vibrio scophthalmi TaxID=45658 RepID=A0A1E3WFG9_9VIBR|nr:hypothetical protein [Vibrio scophthalmi]ODS04500.1 hypothetical protein VSF3289_03639 [Vibrio scophthalmi]